MSAPKKKLLTMQVAVVITKSCVTQIQLKIMTDNDEMIVDTSHVGHDNTHHPSDTGTVEGNIAQKTVIDIADFVDSNTTSPNDELMMSLIKNRAPDKSLKFPPKTYRDKRKPSGETKRYCLHEWFETYDFIAYSKSLDGLFCLSCVLFPMPSHKGTKANILISKPYRNWKDAREDLKSHSMLEYHKDSTARWQIVRSMAEYGPVGKSK
ncbi:Uncharacterised protein at_DN0512 [Pycnogonum litorale]